VKPGDRVLDCATGTGDLAIAFKKAVGDSGRVAGTDFVPEMIELARRKANGIEWDVADVTTPLRRQRVRRREHLLRHPQRRRGPSKGIAEMARVVRAADA
jgi:demethylmenaquinone methyltransferase/2-methoxy-6-polyprenyl-1,4-benzoquinol methylase